MRGPEIEARFVNLKAQAIEAIELLPQVPQDLLGAIQSIDSPPALAASDASIIARLVDGAILVVQPAKNCRRLVTRAAMKKAKAAEKKDGEDDDAEEDEDTFEVLAHGW